MVPASGSPLTIGHIAYANCEPFFHYLRDCGFDGKILAGVPSELNRSLAAGDLDLSPSSSFEFLRNWREYLILPGLSISSVGKVLSVLVVSSRPPHELQGREIFLTGESASSVHLLQILLREFYGFTQVSCQVPRGPVEDHVRHGHPTLLIGDRALRMAQMVPESHVFDLGELWQRYTGLPFVFALWILRRNVAEHAADAVVKFYHQLQASTDKALRDLPKLARALSQYRWYGDEALVRYWRSMSYRLDEAHVKGLQRYAELLVKYGFISELPEIEFFSPGLAPSGDRPT